MSYTFDSKGIRGTEEDRMRHTPTPWRSSETCDHRPAIQDARGLTVASWDSATMELFGDVRPTILRAVNSHAALVDALEMLLKDIENNGYTLEVWGPGHPHLQQAKQAIAQAEGGV